MLSLISLTEIMALRGLVPRYSFLSPSTTTKNNRNLFDAFFFFCCESIFLQWFFLFDVIRAPGLNGKFWHTVIITSIEGLNKAKSI